MTNEPNIVQAWLATPTEKGKRDFPHSTEPFYVVKYADGTGNVVEQNGKRMYSMAPTGVEFSSVEDHMKWPEWTTTVEVDPTSVPAA